MTALMNSKANEALNRVDTQVAMLAAAENGLERGYARLGYLILEVSEMQYWRITCDSFYQYLQTLAVKFNRSAGRLQQYFLAVRDLNDTFTIHQLEAIGITKAVQLRQAKDYAIVLPSVVVDAALDSNVTAAALRKLIATTLRLPDDPGDYFDMEFEFIVTPEERATLEDAVNAAMHEDPVIKSTISKMAQKKEVALRFAMEFLGSHPAESQS
jgi:hypothetical protein